MANSGGGSSALKPRPETRPRLSKNAIRTAAQAGFKRAEAKLVASGYKTRLTMGFETDCTAHSYGQVREFFKSNPCTWLARAYVQLGYSEVLVAISWVEMPSTRLSRAYKRLVDTPDSGGIVELSRDTALYRKISYANSAHTSGMQDTSVWNVQAQPIAPKTTAELTEILIDSRQQ
jgi:hypothetical protein